VFVIDLHPSVDKLSVRFRDFNHLWHTFAWSLHTELVFLMLYLADFYIIDVLPCRFIAGAPTYYDICHMSIGAVLIHHRAFILVSVLGLDVLGNYVG